MYNIYINIIAVFVILFLVKLFLLKHKGDPAIIKSINFQIFQYAFIIIGAFILQYLFLLRRKSNN